MKSIVGVYDSQEAAVEAVRELKNSGIPVRHISLIGKAALTEKLHLSKGQMLEGSEVGVGLTVGSILGVLTGVGVFAIPGFGFLYGAGALIGAIAGFDIGLVGGGVVAIFTAIGVDETSSVKYEQLLQEDKFLVLVKGPEDEVKQAKDILHTLDQHIGV